MVAGPSPVINDSARTDVVQYASWAAKILLYIIVEVALRDSDLGSEQLRLALCKCCYI